MTGADLRQTLSKNIKLLRNQRSLSQIELAEKADISIPFLSNIERGNKWPYPDTLTKLAEALGVEVHSLFITNRSPKEEMEQLKKELVYELKETVSYAVKESFAEEYKKEKKKK
jgi:transcriptional regulator with XRE-family HTH domain